MAHHRQHGASVRVEGDDGPLRGAQGGIGDVLELRAKRQPYVRADDRRVQQAVEAWAQKRGWRPGQYAHEIVGTDQDGNIAVTVYPTAGEPARDPSERPKPLAIRLHPRDYTVVRELP